MSRPGSTTRLTRGRVALVVISAVVGGLTWAVLPPAAAPALPAAFAIRWPVVRGAFHVHSVASDGTGTLDEIAAAAAAARLQFVIVTDHGDGTRAPAPPAYRHGVLCIEGVEVNTTEGHVIALGLPRMPYRLAGPARDVIEDVRRFGGFTVAAHPGSPKAGLAWRAWDAPFDGLEWLNADSEWRDEVWGALGRALLTYAIRPSETLAALIDRPEAVFRRWDELGGRRRVPAIAGADAHARLGLRTGNDPYEDRILARLPAYEVSFRTFSNHVVLDTPLAGDAAADADQVLSAIRQGRLFTSLDGLAGIEAFEAWSSSGPALARVGESLDDSGPVVIEARMTAPQGAVLTLLRDGLTVYETATASLRVDVGTQPGVYRLEVRLPSRAASPEVPWVLANPFYVGVGEPVAATGRPALEPAGDRTGVPTWAWRPESSPGSTSTLRSGRLGDETPALEWRFSLAAADHAPYAALRFPFEQGLAGHERLRMRIEADRPSRIWVQLRAPGGAAGERWGQTVYVDETLREIEVTFAAFRPLGAVSTPQPRLENVDALLLVVDSVHSLAGSSGLLRIPDLWLVR